MDEKNFIVYIDFVIHYIPIYGLMTKYLQYVYIDLYLYESFLQMDLYFTSLKLDKHDCLKFSHLHNMYLNGNTN